MSDGTAIRHNNRGQERIRRRAAAIADLAEAQYGVVTRAQLIALGLTAREIDYRIATSRLHVVHRRVFSVGHRILSQRARWMAAVLAGGPDAVLSHRSATALYGLLPSSSGRIHVTAPRKLHPRRGLVFHRADLRPDEIDRVEGIPVTGLSRTILDLASRGAQQDVDRALHEAEVKRLSDGLSLDDLIARYPRRQGVAKIKAALADRRMGTTATRSELEERFLKFIARQGLPRPEINAWLVVREAQFEVDCLWREAGLVVELDGRAAHGTSRAFEHDRARDRALQVAGLRVVRVTWRQLNDRDQLDADLRALLVAGGSHTRTVQEDCS